MQVIVAALGGAEWTSAELERGLAAFSKEADVEEIAPNDPKCTLRIVGCWKGSVGEWLEMELRAEADSIALVLRIAQAMVRAIDRPLRVVASGIESQPTPTSTEIGYRAFDLSPGRPMRPRTNDEADELSRVVGDDFPRDELHELFHAALADAPTDEAAPPQAARGLTIRARFTDARMSQLASQIANAKESHFEPQPDGRILLRLVNADGSRRLAYLKKEEAAALRGE